MTKSCFILIFFIATRLNAVAQVEVKGDTLFAYHAPEVEVYKALAIYQGLQLDLKNSPESYYHVFTSNLPMKKYKKALEWCLEDSGMRIWVEGKRLCVGNRHAKKLK